MNLVAAHNFLRYENPFLLASGPPTASRELIARGFEAGWAGAVTKTIRPDSMPMSDVSPRFYAFRHGQGDVYGFENIELVSRRSTAYWMETIAGLKRGHPEKILIASIMGDSGRESWENLARRCEGAGADALELNFSCPHGMPERGVGAAIGQDAGITGRITGWVRGATSLPVIVKLTPNVTDVRPIALAAIEAGADALAAINTVQCLAGVDLETLTPYPQVNGFSTFGGYSGAAVKPIGLRVVAQAAATTGAPIHGLGGIRTWQDAVEYMAVGATVVQVCTEVMLRGFGIVRGLIQGLSEYMQRKGFESPANLTGAALKRLSSHEAMSRTERVVPEMAARESCLLCGRCVTACRDGGYGALRIEDQAVAIDTAKCDGCSLCVLVCPAQALAMRERKPAQAE